MLRRNVIVVLTCISALVLASCGMFAAANTTQTSTVDGLTIALESPPAPKVNEQAIFVVTLTDGAGNPVDGADVYLELTMDTMTMGSNQPIATPEGNGRYRAQSALDMVGDWSFIVHATVNGKDYAATFDSTVVEQDGGTRGQTTHETMDH